MNGINHSRNCLPNAQPNSRFSGDAHTRAQIKSRTQLNGKYAEVSTPELSAVRGK